MKPIKASLPKDRSRLLRDSLSNIPMAFGIKLLLCLLLSIILNKQAYSQADSTIKNVTWTTGAHTVSIAGKIIAPDSSSHPDEIADSAHVDFISGSEITLKPGFDAGGFTGAGYFDARINPCNLLKVSVTSTNVSCYGGGNGSATAHASGIVSATFPYTYYWSSSEGTDSMATVLAAGAYLVTVTANGCSVTATATITQPAALIASITSTTGVSCTGGSNGAATVSSLGGTTSYTYSWSPSGGTDSTASGLATGSYSVTVTDANGCSASASASISLVLHSSADSAISVNPNAVNADFNIGDTALWFTFTADTNALGMKLSVPLSTDATYAELQSVQLYSGSSAGGLTLIADWYAHNNHSGIPEIKVYYSSLTIGSSYYLKVKRTTSDCGFFSARVEDIPAASSDCGNTCDLVGDGTFVGFDPNCPDSQNPNTINPFSECVKCWYCSHGTPQISSDAASPAQGYYAMMWAQNYTNGSFGEGIASTLYQPLRYQPLSTKSKIVYLFHMKYRVDPQSCTTSTTPGVNIHAVLTTELAATNAGFTCGGGGGMIPPTVAPADEQYITTQSDATCDWKEVFICVPTPTIDDLQVLWIYPTTTDPLVWIDIDDVHLYRIDAGIEGNVCSCQTETLSTSVCAFDESTTGLSISTAWSGPDSYSSASSSITISPVSTASTYTAVVTATYSGGSCTATDAITLKPATDPSCKFTVTISPTPAQICSGDAAVFYAEPLLPQNTPLNLQPQWSWSWTPTGSNTNGQVSTTYPYSVTFSPDNDFYELSVTETNSAGCSGTYSSENFHWTTEQAIGVTAPVTCLGDNKYSISAVTNPLDASGTTFDYQWYIGDILDQPLTGETANTIIVGTGTKYPIGFDYTVTANDPNGLYCTGIGTATIDGIVLSIGTPTSDCNNGGSATVSVTNPGGDSYTFTWNPMPSSPATVSSTTTSTSGTHLPVGTYIVTATQQGTSGGTTSCTAETTVTITNNNFAVDVIPTYAICTPLTDGSAMAIASGGGGSGYSYQWYTGDNTNNAFTGPGATSSTINNIPGGDYTVKVNVGSGTYCSITKTVTVDDSLGVGVTITASPSNSTICIGSVDQVQLTAIGNGGSFYSWLPTTGLSNPNIANPVATPTVTTVYTVTLTGTYSGCYATASITVFVATTPSMAAITPYDIQCGKYCVGITVTGGTSPYTVTVNSYPDNISPFTYTAPGPDAVCDLLSDQSLNSTGCSANQACILITDAMGCKVADDYSPPTGVAVLTASCTSTNTDCSTSDEGTITVTVQNGTTPYTYNWGTGSTTTSVNPYTITNLIAGAYIVTVTDASSDACSATTSATITSGSSTTCCTNGTIYQGGSVSPTPGQTYSIDKNITISGDVVFDHNTMYIKDSKSITIATGGKLTITNSILEACGNMWRGIVVAGGPVIIVYSTIEDAQYGVESSGLPGGDLVEHELVGAGFELVHTNFENDYVGIYLHSAGIVAPWIENCIFTCDNGYLKEGYPGQIPSFPAGSHSFAGIESSDNAFFFNEGNNTFEYLNNGIFSWNSNLYLGGMGTFNSIQAYDPYIGQNYFGAGICAIGGAVNNSFTYIGNGMGNAANFDQCDNGIETDQMNTTITGAVMTNIYDEGISTGSSFNLSNDINANEITISASRTPSPIRANLNPLKLGIFINGLPGAYHAHINGNHITMNNYNLVEVTAGIAVLPGPGINNDAEIDNNEIYMKTTYSQAYGIVLSGASTYSADKNCIYMEGTVTSGIGVESCTYQTLSNNTIKGEDPNTGITYEASSLSSVYSLLSTNYTYECNTIDYTYHGFDFAGGCSGLLQTNHFHNHNVGLNVAPYGAMGTQSHTGNLWHVQSSTLYGAYVNSSDLFIYDPIEPNLFYKVPVLYFPSGSGPTGLFQPKTDKTDPECTTNNTCE